MLNKEGVRQPMQYDRMTIQEIRDMGAQIKAAAHPDGHLWLWTTNTHIPEAVTVVQAWGYQWKTMLTMPKAGLGLGWWLRGKTEHCIFAARTENRRRNPGSYSTLMEQVDRLGHSVKPDSAFDIMRALSFGPYLEVFARKERKGWHTMISDKAPETQHLDAHSKRRRPVIIPPYTPLAPPADYLP